MRNHKQIITDAGSDLYIAESLGVSINTMRSWKQRDSIPANYWKWFCDHGGTSWEELHGSRVSA